MGILKACDGSLSNFPGSRIHCRTWRPAGSEHALLLCPVGGDEGLQVQQGQPPKPKEGRGKASGRRTHGEAQPADVRPSPEVDMHSSGKSWLLLTGCVVFYVIYLLFGALVFSAIERPMEEKLLRELELLKQEFLNQSCASAASLERLLLKALAASRSGVSVLRNSSAPSSWDLTSSMFFANTLVTTIGYGNTIPLSAAGKAFSIFYALIGVPFTMLVLTVCVQKLLYPLVIAPIGLLHRLGMRLRPATLVHFLLLLLLVILGFFVAPAVVFSTAEMSWSFLDGIYFCFISLCTIGLGDFVPATHPRQKYRQLYQVGIMVYLFMGLMMMYLLLRTLHKMADLHGLTTFLQLPRCEESDQDEDREPIVENEHRAARPCPAEKASSKPLDPGSQSSYNTINKD